MRDARVRCGPVEPDSLHGGLEAVFAEFVVLLAVDDLGHVGVLHWEDYVGGRGRGVLFGPHSRAGHEGELILCCKLIEKKQAGIEIGARMTSGQG